ncbi:MAG: nucleotidyltransferase family protein [Candidatus Latescibacteria bacterium]|nr:nucleotidyltransferase family protein [Candidatus Latescibacterota bacterium]
MKSPCSKAIILAAGRGSRMQKQIEDVVLTEEERVLADTGQKGMLPFEKGPFLNYSIDDLIKAGYRELCLVVGPNDPFICQYYDREAPHLFPDLSISYAYQDVPLGTAHALRFTESFVHGEPFVVLNADNLYSVPVLCILRETLETYAMIGYDAAGFRYEDDRLHRFGLIETHNGYLSQIVEKPEDPWSFKVNDTLSTLDDHPVIISGQTLVSMNIWRFPGDTIFDACRRTPISSRNEYELPNTAALLLREGVRIKVYYACEHVPDLTNRRDIVLVRRQIQEPLE